MSTSAAQIRHTKSKAEQKRIERRRERLIPHRDPEDAKRRKRLESNPGRWLRHYLPERFPLPFGSVHLAIIRAASRAMTAGTPVTVAAPRGFGKTALLWGMALYAVCSGKARFPVVAGWKAGAGAELLQQWLDALSDNDSLAADYPCLCDPFRDSTAGKRLQGILRSLEPDERAGCDVRKGRGLVVLPETCEPTTGRKMPQAALAGVSINGSVKGLNVGLLNGESLRPDILLLDDPQDTATAESETLVQKVLKRIDYGLRSLSGPQRRLTVMAAVTCVEREDVAEHLLARPGTETIRCGQVVSWPAGWDDKDSATRAMWGEWNAARLEGLAARDGGRAARAFYRAHRAELTKGMRVSWRHRYHIGDAERPADPDALYSAMWDYYELGEEAFMAERQNEPLKRGVTVYTLTPEVICSRATDRQPWTVPEWSRLRVAATDVNPSYGLTWGVLAFGADQTSAVLGYGIDPMTIRPEATEGERARAIYEGLVRHGQKLAALPCRPELWVIDAGGAQFDVVLRFAAESGRVCGLQATAMTGRGARNYRPYGRSVVGRPREQCHLASDTRGRKWLAGNVDYWREIAQRAWTGSIGAPGSCSLPAGSHRTFAEQICREQLSGKAEVSGETVWVWHTAPGPHDYGDVMTMAYTAASWSGIGTSGIRPRVRYVETRKAKVTEDLL